MRKYRKPINSPPFLITSDRLLNCYKFIQAFSIDVVAGAVIFSMFIAMVYNIEVPAVVYTELALAVWCIYTWDHLNDVRNIEKPSTYRHYLHKKHLKLLSLLLLFALLTAAGLIFFLPVKTMYLGTATAILVLFYFLIIHFFPSFYHKETLIAVLYGLGVTLGPFSCLKTFTGSGWLLCPIFAVTIAFTNLIIFSEFDKHTDKADGYPSLALKLGWYTLVMIRTLLVLQTLVLTGLYLAGIISFIVFSCFFMMVAVLAIVYLLRNSMYRGGYYRIIGDGIFYIPLIFLL